MLMTELLGINIITVWINISDVIGTDTALTPQTKTYTTQLWAKQTQTVFGTQINNVR